MTVLDFPECLEEMIKYMDFMPDDDEARKNLLLAFVRKAIVA